MRFLLLSFFLSSSIIFAQPTDKITPESGYIHSTVEDVICGNTLKNEGWTNLAQPLFWQEIMSLSPDSCLVNIAASRVIVAKMKMSDWKAQTDQEKTAFRENVRTAHNLPSDARIFVTTGKNDFYQFEKVLPSLQKGIEEFEKNGVDPWFAQAILLIESPGHLAKSTVGAYGPFQLMPAVARAQGLTVNRSIDERKDFDRSAYGASQLIKRICLPEARRILNAKGISYNENDVWFRLFVLHIYHAGAANVGAVINKINPTEGGQQLITKMWQTKAAKFKNSSQNYSQLALASQMIVAGMIE